MTQQVLARKWRPTSFQDLIGQDHVRKALTHALSSQRLHHAYLFSGTRGVGKTTIARILARCLNCESGITATPCGQCGACQAISENRFVDLIEVDAASRTKVDDTRDLLENVSYAPTLGRYKIYLIDEVHMLTSQSFNALLKTLEEPPEHVVFLFATTDPHKLLPTVLSRCLQFHLRDLSADQIQGHLHHILEAEAIAFESEALWQLARAGRGSMRDAITLLDQAIAFGEGRVQTDDVIQMLGVQGLSEVPAMLADLARNDANALLARVHELAMQTPDWMALVSGMQTVLHQVAVRQISAQSLGHLPPSEQRAVDELAALMAPEFLQLAYQFTLTGYRDMPMASDPRSAFEMLLLRMLAFRPARMGEMISSDTLPQANASEGNEPEPEPELSVDPVVTPAQASAELADAPIGEAVVSEPEPALAPVIDPEPTLAPDSALVVESTVAIETTDASAEPVRASHVAAAPAELAELTSDPSAAVAEVAIDHGLAPQVVVDAPTESVDMDDDEADEPEIPVLTLQPEQWVIEARALGLHGMTGSLILQSVLLSATESLVQLALKPSTARLINETHLKRIADAFARQTGVIPEIQIETRDSLPETPEDYASRMRHEAIQRAQELFQDDPFVSTLTRDLGAKVRVETIQPRDDKHV